MCVSYEFCAFSVSLKNSIVILIVVSLKVNIALGGTNILTIIILLTLEYRIFSLYVCHLQFLYCFIAFRLYIYIYILLKFASNYFSAIINRIVSLIFKGQVAVGTYNYH